MAGPVIEKTDAAKARTIKIILMLVVLIPFISSALIFVYLWLRGVKFGM